MTAPESVDYSAVSNPIFGRDELLSAIHGDHDLMEQFITLFLRDFPRKIDTLRAAAPAEDRSCPGNAAALRNAAHRILGSARTMRLYRLSDAALDLQRMVDSGSTSSDDLAAGTVRVVEEYRRVVALLER